MGKVKLTLTVDEQVVANAKLLAKKQQKSLSKLIEELLETDAMILTNSTSDALQLRGIAKSKLSHKTDKQIREMMYKDRYGL